jgi:hypothetical protein
MATAKSLTKRGGPAAPSALHGSFGPILYPVDRTNVIGGCLQSDCDHRRQVEAQVKALLATVDVNFRLCDVSKERIIEITKACGFDGIPKLKSPASSKNIVFCI